MTLYRSILTFAGIVGRIVFIERQQSILVRNEYALVDEIIDRLTANFEVSGCGSFSELAFPISEFGLCSCGFPAHPL